MPGECPHRGRLADRLGADKPECETIGGGEGEEVLRSVSAFEQMLQYMKSVPVSLQNILVATSGATATTRTEGTVKPITKMAWQAIQVTPKETTGTLAVTAELLRFASSNVFAQELTGAVAEAIDASFVSEITTGITPTTSAGGGPLGILNDLDAALASLTLPRKVFLLVSSDIAKHWAVKTTAQSELLFPSMTPFDGQVQGMEVIVTNAVSGQIVAVDPTQLFAASGNLLFDFSTEATLQFDTTPDSPPTSATNLVSLWQNNFAGIRATRYWAVGRGRTTAVSVISNVTYTLDSPA